MDHSGTAPLGSDRTQSHIPNVALIPHVSRWADLLRHNTSDAGLALRAELGLPTDRPIIMSGHQAQWWHAGILAKGAALQAACDAFGAASAWLVVDQDASDSLALLYPRVLSGDPLPQRARWAIAPSALADQLRADVALADLPAFAPTAAPDDAATQDARRGLRAIADSASRWSGASSAAEQVARANGELSASLISPQPPLLFATRLNATSALRGLLERMTNDPRRCVEAYNAAVAEHAASVHGIAPLSCSIEKSRYELPLWQLSPRDGQGRVTRPTPRKRVFAHTLADAPLNTLAPRALLMTALLRWLACDLFIHGTGGGSSQGPGEQDAPGYDRIAESWFQGWLGVSLAPTVVATATLYMPMGLEPTATPETLLAARRRLHAMRHSPAALGDAHAQRDKDQLLARIGQTTDPQQRRALYRQMHDLLATLRATHAPALSTAGDLVTQQQHDLTRQSVLHERAWPWPTLPRTRLLALRDTVTTRFTTREPNT